MQLARPILAIARMGMRPLDRIVIQPMLQNAQVVIQVGDSMVLLVRQTRVLVLPGMELPVQIVLRTMLKFVQVATLDGFSLVALVRQRPPPLQPLQLFSLDTSIPTVVFGTDP
jgi:hypothetical protein